MEIEVPAPPPYSIKDSGEREEFESGMVRDTAENKIDYTLAFDGPLLDRYASHLTEGAKKYAKRNWMQARGPEEMERFMESATRHFRQWQRRDTDEDHFSSTVFNMNGFEYVEAQLWVPE